MDAARATFPPALRCDHDCDGRMKGWFDDWGLAFLGVVVVVVLGTSLGLLIREVSERRHEDHVCVEYRTSMMLVGKAVVPVRRCVEWGTIVTEGGE